MVVSYLAATSSPILPLKYMLLYQVVVTNSSVLIIPEPSRWVASQLASVATVEREWR
jgi:hypothetical protein